jgi:hypothetical protein
MLTEHVDDLKTIREFIDMCFKYWFKCYKLTYIAHVTSSTDGASCSSKMSTFSLSLSGKRCLRDSIYMLDLTS